MRLFECAHGEFAFAQTQSDLFVRVPIPEFPNDPSVLNMTSVVSSANEADSPLLVKNSVNSTTSVSSTHSGVFAKRTVLSSQMNNGG